MSTDKWTLEEVCEKGSSSLMQKNLKLGTGAFPIYGASGLLGFVDFYHRQEEYIGIVKDGAGVGRAMLLPAQSSCIGTMQYLIPNQNVTAHYLYYAIQNMNLAKYNTGATIPHIYFRDYKRESIPKRSIQEQEIISEKIDKVENIIKIKREQLSHLDDLVKSQFIEMFGGIPQEDFVPLSELCKIITDGTHQPPKFYDNGIPFLFVSNIANNEINYDTEKYISKETYLELIRRTPIEIGDILLSTVGSYGHPAIVTDSKKFCFQRHIAYLKPDGDLIESRYLHGALLSPIGQEQIERGVKGIAQKTLNLSEIRKIRVPLVSMEQQKAYSAFCLQLDKSKFRIKQNLEKLEILYKSLLQEYFG